jgi:hypothetical protein
MMGALLCVPEVFLSVKVPPAFRRVPPAFLPVKGAVIL